MSQVALPSAVDGVTASWLTEVLRIAFPGTVVTELRIDAVIERFATSVRVLVTYNEIGRKYDLPPSLFVKGAFGRSDLEPEFVAAFAREVDFYRQIAPRLPIDVPRCYFGQADLERACSVVVLEDLGNRDVRIGRPRTAVGPETVASALEILASLHAYWWDHPRLADLEQYPGTLAPAVMQLLTPDRWLASLARPCGDLVPPPLRDPSAIRSAVETMWAFNAEPPHCLIHGDVHLGNAYLYPDGQLGMFDWQAASAGSWAYDVARLVSGSLAIETRRTEEHNLIRYYLDRLEFAGVQAPVWDEAWLAYRRNLIHGLRWVTCAPGTYPEVDVAAYVGRHAAAVTDLNALESLG